MSHFEYAECPQCGKTAYGRSEIEENLVIAMVVLHHNLGVRNVDR